MNNASDAEENNKINPNLFEIYPNPAESEINLLLQSSTVFNHENSKLEIIDISGQAKKTIKLFNGNELTFDVDNLESGVYFIKLFNGEVCTFKKFIVNK